ncbi:isocitrate lyase/phosphoenolpyruvate mutase family protein [Deinococcus sp. QL22]|uniref:isocitrate lyase/phosphoenolpyruvate mutase family protein n=1 Tax=Deinococcus sp. QL22 TaxID=2939437 RepID=UPI0020175B47|nr:isocitrate lyase/phosphoenolpyruvate mutase family protein [Deinococcus sp. QL22]UQN08099.1 isocitrate lyase/phosphoenolpyruvate mutase family protein [Deinococcus sp. QL22]
MNQYDAAQAFHSLHQQGFILPNAWDAGSARVLKQAGFPAIGTTSAGIAYATGRVDGQNLTREDMRREVQAIIETVSVPVFSSRQLRFYAVPVDDFRKTEVLTALET